MTFCLRRSNFKASFDYDNKVVEYDKLKIIQMQTPRNIG